MRSMFSLLAAGVLDAEQQHAGRNCQMAGNECRLAL